MKVELCERKIERRAGESFRIGNAIEVCIDSVKGGLVRMRCRASRLLQLVPGEVVDSIAAENRRAAGSRLPTLEDLCTAGEEE